jgi:hypothetical protein
MILSREEIIEKYPSGNYKYIETRAVISRMWITQYPNHRVADDGTLWIRIGVNKKFKPDGSLAWEIKYDDCGNVVK